MKKYIITIIILAISKMTLLAGGPWPQPKGEGHFKLSEWWTIFDEHYTDLGLLDPNVTTGLFNTALYAEYGLTDRLTGIVYFPLFSRNYSNNLRSATTEELIIPGDAINSIGDIDLIVKYGLSPSDSRLALSASIGFGLPTGQSVGGSQGNLQTGDGEFNQFLQLDLGTGFNIGKSSAYVSTYAGFNNRTKSFSEEFRYGLEVGISTPNQKIWLSGKLNGVESFNNGATAETVTSTSIFANNSEFVSLGVEANIYLSDNMGISGGFTNVLSGKIVASAPSYSIGVFYNLR